MSGNASNLMGQLLMKSWAMCAEGCETCSYPLMRERKTLNTVCVSCQSLLCTKITEGVKMEAGDNPNELKIQIEGKTKTIKVVNKQLKLVLKEELEEVPEEPEVIVDQ